MRGIATAVHTRAVSFELKTVLFLGVVVVLGFSVLYPFILLLIFLTTLALNSKFKPGSPLKEFFLPAIWLKITGVTIMSL